MNIKFGTDGWRAIIGKEFTKANVERVSLAIAKYVAENFGFDKPILIGYDPRNKADKFSAQCAEIFVNAGFNVYYSSRIVPTPVLAYNAKFRNACAIMFTASHNPPEYLGMKFIPDYAGPATSDITDAIIDNIDKSFVQKGLKGVLHKTDFAFKYYQHLDSLIDYEAIKDLNTNIVFDGLYSAAIGYFDKILDANGIKYKTLHMYHDCNFGGGMPDPKPNFLKELISKVKSVPNSIGLANDGDADRFGVINENGEYVSPNEIIAILLKHLLDRGFTGAVVKTVGSSLLIDEVAKKLHIPVIETPVGFKHVGEAMRNNNVIIGGEESGGLSILGHIPEKDGLLANLLVLEAMAYANKTLVELQDEIYMLVGNKFFADRIDLTLENTDEMEGILAKVKALDKIGCYDITEKSYKDGVKLMLGDNTKILIRPSGTEPLLRIYFETDSEEKLNSLKYDLIL